MTVRCQIVRKRIKIYEWKECFNIQHFSRIGRYKSLQKTEEKS